VFVWPPPVTEAALTSGEDADGRHAHGQRDRGIGAPVRERVDRVHESGARPQVQPVPANAVAVNPAGSVSVTVTVPEEAPVPTFDTEIV
jgi:hypothetical protein